MSPGAPAASPVPGGRALRGGLAAVLDQFLFVGASSLMMLLLGRGLGATEYGGFVLAYTTFLLLAQAQTALFAEPMSVFAPSRYRASGGAYVRAVERLNLRASLLAAAGFLAAAGASAALGQAAAAAAFLGTALACPALLALWLRRRVLYVQGRIGRSLAASGLLLACGVAALFVLHRLGALGAFSGMAALGAAALAGLLVSRGPGGPAAPAPEGMARAHWEYGRWALLTALLGWCGNLYFFVLPIRHGLEGAAELRALLNFVYPVIQANQALTLPLLPRWAAHETRAGFSRALGRLAGAWALVALALCAGGAVAGPWLVHAVYAGRYDAVAGLLPWVFVLVLPDGLSYLFASGLRASRSPREVAMAAVAVPAVALFPGVALVFAWGIPGAVAALLLASLAQLALTWRAWVRPAIGGPAQS